MPRYDFPLEPVLKQRKIKQDQSELAVAEKGRSVRALEARLAEVRRLLRESGERYAREQESEASGSALRLYYSYFERLQAEGRRLRDDLGKEAEVLRSLRETLQERSRERRVVERLKRNGYQRFVADLNAREGKALDETAGIFHRRKRRGR